MQDIKDRIAEKAKEMFMTLGIRSVSMDDIALALGMSKKTLYQYFEDKDALVDRSIEDEIKISIKDCMANKTKSKNAIEEILLTIKIMEDLYGDMNPNTFHDLQKYHPKAYSKFEKHKNDFFYKIVFDNIERGKEEGLYREEIDTEVLSLFRIESFMLVFNPLFIKKLKKKIVNLEKEITIHYLYGLVNPKGHKLLNKYIKNLNKV